MTPSGDFVPMCNLCGTAFDGSGFHVCNPPTRAELTALEAHVAALESTNAVHQSKVATVEATLPAKEANTEASATCGACGHQQAQHYFGISMACGTCSCLVFKEPIARPTEPARGPMRGPDGEFPRLTQWCEQHRLMYSATGECPQPHEPAPAQSPAPVSEGEWTTLGELAIGDVFENPQGVVGIRSHVNLGGEGERANRIVVARESGRETLPPSAPVRRVIVLAPDDEQVPVTMIKVIQSGINSGASSSDIAFGILAALRERGK